MAQGAAETIWEGDWSRTSLLSLASALKLTCDVPAYSGLLCEKNLPYVGDTIKMHPVPGLPQLLWLLMLTADITVLYIFHFSCLQNESMQKRDYSIPYVRPSVFNNYSPS